MVQTAEVQTGTQVKSACTLQGYARELAHAVKAGRIRAGYTLVDSLRGRGGARLQAVAKQEVRALAEACATIHFGGAAGTTTSRTVKVSGEKAARLLSTGGNLLDSSWTFPTNAQARREKAASDSTSPNYRAHNPEDVEDAIGEVCASLLALDVADCSRQVLVYAEVVNADRWAQVGQTGKLTALGVKEPRVRDWIRRNATSRFATGHLFARTSVSVHGKTRARNIGEVVLAVKRGKATCASEREEVRVTRFLGIADALPGVKVHVEETGRVLTWRSHVKLTMIRHLRRVGDRATMSSIDPLVADSNEDLPTSPAGDLLILSSGGDSTAQEVLERQGVDLLLRTAERAIQRRGELEGWYQPRVEGALAILPLLFEGEDSAGIARRTNLTLRTVQRRIEDIRTACRPVFLPEECSVEEVVRFITTG